MRKLGIAAAGLAAAACAVVASTALAEVTHAAKVLPFKASYSGTAVVKVTEQVADIQADGTGTATVLGSGKINGHGTGDASAQPCVPFTGPGAMTGAKGKLQFTVIAGSEGCGDEQGQVFSVTGKIKVTKGTGKLAKARGTLKFTGVYDRGAGTFSVKFKGNLTL